MYNERLLNHFQNPRNVGELKTPALTVEVTNPACGDILRLSALVEEGRVMKAAFKTRGCTASIAASSALTEWLTGRTLAEVSALKPAQVEDLVGGLADERKHAAFLCVDGVRAVLRQINCKT